MAAFDLEPNSRSVFQIEVDGTEILLIPIVGMGPGDRPVRNVPAGIDHEQPVRSNDKSDLVGIFRDGLNAQNFPRIGGAGE